MQKALIIRTLSEGLFPSFLLRCCSIFTKTSLLLFVEIFAFLSPFLLSERVVNKKFSLLLSDECVSDE